MINEFLQSKIALDRIQSFLNVPDVDTSYIMKTHNHYSQTALKITNGNFAWLDENAKPKEKVEGKADSPKKPDSPRLTGWLADWLRVGFCNKKVGKSKVHL